MENKNKDINNKESKPSNISQAVPMVAIGASAGGLESFELFLKNVPEKSGIAYIIIQHLDPNHKGMLTELLSRSTNMSVSQIKDRTKIQPDSVYVIPPNKNISVINGVLHLFIQDKSHGSRLPVDYFFKSLANDQGDKSIGVILSGMGSDGTLGIKAIKEKGGMVFVQAPDSAKFDGMPKSAIDTGLPLVISPVEDLPKKIISFIRHLPDRPKDTDQIYDEKTQGVLEKIFILIREKTGNDFLSYKRTTVYRRIERRMSIHQIDKINTYFNFLLKNPHEIELLFKELLVGVTSFFRDPDAWEDLKEVALQELLAKKNSGSTLKAWVAGCSTGEEAYSLAITLREEIENLKVNKNINIQIFATDIDIDAINKAREAVYPSNIETEVAPKILKKYFTKVENGYMVNKYIREMIIFATQNIIKDPPFTKLDILLCRNLLIYINQEMQKKLIPLFYYSLKSDGILFLGNSETVGTFKDFFDSLYKKTKIYKKINSDILPETFEYPISNYNNFKNIVRKQGEVKSFIDIQKFIKEFLLENYCSPGVLVNTKGDILYISGKTGNYLEPAAGKADWNIFSMARNGLRYELVEAFNKAVKQQSKIIIRAVTIKIEENFHEIDLIIHPLDNPSEMIGKVMIIFNNIKKYQELKSNHVTAAKSPQSTELEKLKIELDHEKQKLQDVRKEMQSTNEELQSTNEELQSTNEELQSTNEELTTSKEEMQSMNEELQTLNSELQQKVEMLSEYENDMKNLLESTNIATLFLDEKLIVRRFTTQAAQIIKLIPADIGRPVTDISTNLIYPEFIVDIQQVLRVLSTIEKQVKDKDGRWFIISIMPYRTISNKIDGVVITFSDITSVKMLEEKLNKEKSGYKKQILDLKEKYKKLKTDRNSNQ